MCLGEDKIRYESDRRYVNELDAPKTTQWSPVENHYLDPAFPALVSGVDEDFLSTATRECIPLCRVRGESDAENDRSYMFSSS